MASDGNPGNLLGTSLLQGSQAPTVNTLQPGGKALPPSGNPAAPAAPHGGGDRSTAGHVASSAKRTSRGGDPQSLVASLNKYLNDSGRPDQFRVDPASRNTLIQEINPATGEVIGEFSVDEFPELARSVGATGLLVDSRA